MSNTDDIGLSTDGQCGLIHILALVEKTIEDICENTEITVKAQSGSVSNISALKQG